MINSYLKFCKHRYNVQLESIAVNGQVLPIDSVVFSKGGMETFGLRDHPGISSTPSLWHFN